jgi:hypothetical protein
MERLSSRINGSVIALHATVRIDANIAPQLMLASICVACHSALPTCLLSCTRCEMSFLVATFRYPNMLSRYLVASNITYLPDFYDLHHDYFYSVRIIILTLSSCGCGGYNLLT